MANEVAGLETAVRGWMGRARRAEEKLGAPAGHGTERRSVGVQYEKGVLVADAEVQEGRVRVEKRTQTSNGWVVGVEVGVQAGIGEEWDTVIGLLLDILHVLMDY